MATTHSKKGNRDKALELFEESLRFNQKTKNKADLATTFSNMAIVYYEKGSMQKAKSYSKKAIKIDIEFQNKDGLSKSYTNLALFYLQKEEFDKSIYYLNKGLKVNKKFNDEVSITKYLNNLSSVYYNRRDYNNAIKFASISASIFILSFFMLRAEWSGYVADVNTMKLTIPGKGLMANSILDYVNPIYWLRYFRRIDVDFAKLQQISTSVRDYTSIIQRFFSGDRVPKTSWFYDINLSCIDDTYRLTFRTKNKREQLYAMIVQINQMGSPILNR